MRDLSSYVFLAITIAVACGANARVARLIAEDEITAPFRAWLIRKFGETNLLVRWAHCPWCCGWWTAWPITLIAWTTALGWRHMWHDLLVFVLAVFAVAHAAGRLNHDHGWRGR